MGQSQPKQTATVPHCSNTTNTRLYLEPEKVEQFKKTILINKLQNPKMVPNPMFQNLVRNRADQSQVDKSRIYNYENCSIYEKELPDEIFVSILGYLTNVEIVKLARVSKNFKNYWIEHSFLWNGRSLNDESFHLFMYFKPIMETPIRTLLYYYHFLHTILHTYKECVSSVGNFVVCKLVLLGQDQCGKSTYADLYMHPLSTPPISNYKPTIGVEFFTKSYQSNNLLTRLQLWDTAGQDRYGSLRQSYLRGANTVIYSFDLSNQASFEHMKQLIKTNASLVAELNANKIIIGFKRDLPRQVSLSQVELLLSELLTVISNDGIPLKDLKLQYFEISSMIDTGSAITFPLLFGLLMSEESLIENASIDKRPVFDGLLQVK